MQTVCPPRSWWHWSTRSERLKSLQPVSASNRFGLRNIYILPTVEGWLVIVTLLILFLCAVNYDVQLIYFSVFATAACVHAGMLLTHRNLHGLIAPELTVLPGFAGGKVEANLRFPGHDSTRRPQLKAILRERRGRFWLRGKTLAQVTFSLDGASTSIRMPMPVGQRGRFALPALSLSTRYPLGLFRAWVLVDTTGDYLVYPTPLGNDELPAAPGAATVGRIHAWGNDEFFGLRAYREGDSVNHVAWQHYARRGQLLAKQFTQPTRETVTLTLGPLPPGPAQERRLSQLTRWILVAEAEGRDYALKAGATECPPGQGPAHRDRCLAVLAQI